MHVDIEDNSLKQFKALVLIVSLVTLHKFSNFKHGPFPPTSLFVCVFHINIVSLVLYTNRVLNVYLQPKSNKGNMMTQQHGTLNPRFVWPHKHLHVLRWIGSSHLHPLAQISLPKSKGSNMVWWILHNLDVVNLHHKVLRDGHE